MNIKTKSIHFFAMIMLFVISLTITAKQSEWQHEIMQHCATKKLWQFEAKDKAGSRIVLSYHITNVHESEYANIVHTVTDIFVAAFAPNEIKFLKEHSNAVVKAKRNDVYAQFKPLFKKGIKSVDWKAVEEKCQHIAQSYWENQVSPEATTKFADSVFIFVTVQDDATKKLLGFVSYRIDDDDARGTVILEPLAVLPEAQMNGLGKLLTASIFKIIPAVKNIFLTVENKNDKALEAYSGWGFVKAQAPDSSHQNMIYAADKSDTLQKAAQALSPCDTSINASSVVAKVKNKLSLWAHKIKNCCVSKESRIDAYMKQWVDIKHFSGSVLVAQKGKIVLAKGYGMANYEHNVPNTMQTKFHIGSMSKQFVSMAIMILVKQGKLALEDTVANFFSDYPNGKKITLYQLLTHTSGIPDYLNSPKFNFKEKRALPATMIELVDLFKDKPLEFIPGSKYSYSNSGYALLGAIIEKVSGQSYGQFLQENILKPLKMNNSGLLDSKTVLLHRAQGYEVIGPVLQNSLYYDPSRIIPAGGMFSTVEDMYRWDRALYTESLVSKDLSNLMFTPYLDYYGFGWVIQKIHGHNVVWHNGSWCDCASIIVRFIDDDICIIILGNISHETLSLKIYSMAQDIAAILFDEKLKFTPKKHVEIAANAKIYDQFVGTYKAQKEDLVFIVTKEKDKLFVECNKIEWNKKHKLEIYPEAENRFFYKIIEAQISFVKDQSDKVTQLILAVGSQNFVAQKIVK